MLVGMMCVNDNQGISTATANALEACQKNITISFASGCKIWKSSWVQNDDICASSYLDMENGCAGWSEGAGANADKEKISGEAKSGCLSDWDTNCLNCVELFSDCS